MVPTNCEINQGDVLVEAHPHSGKPSVITPLDDYGANAPEPSMIFEENPWAPFRTRLDFDIAELIQDTHMNKSQIDRTLKLIHQSIRTPADFTLSDGTDLENVWKAARQKYIGKEVRISILGFNVSIVSFNHAIADLREDFHCSIQGPDC